MLKYGHIFIFLSKYDHFFILFSYFFILFYTFSYCFLFFKYFVQFLYISFSRSFDSEFCVAIFLLDIVWYPKYQILQNNRISIPPDQRFWNFPQVVIRLYRFKKITLGPIPGHFYLNADFSPVFSSFSVSDTWRFSMRENWFDAV